MKKQRRRIVALVSMDTWQQSTQAVLLFSLAGECPRR
ncbi:uncharacterized protein G2W53_038943 [Senna tora]|uniref:Uncharacterized protein n=1 Tax=Senna tora TaxID=362788 RepID=A0A834W2F0_9FABA|nr:uncharacterized protein G2W53_038943 [Senna tora]